MKTTTAKGLTVFALLLFALACPTNAMPPIPRTFKGEVERIDTRQRQLVITNRHDRVVLAWRNTARTGCLKPGDAVKAYYRKEAGKHVISDLRVLRPICYK